jgi:hypothetical protein
VLGHDARSFLRERTPQVVAARRVSLHVAIALKDRLAARLRFLSLHEAAGLIRRG